MKGLNILFSVFQIIIGISGIIAFIILCINDAYETKWLFTAIFALIFLVIGIKGIFDAKWKK